MSQIIYLFFIAILNVLTTHALLTRKKSKLFCLNAFILTTLVIYFSNNFAKEYINGPVLIEYVLYLISVLYLIYIHLVFKESMSKKIFAMFSIWMFSTISLIIAISTTVLFSPKSFNLICILRILLQIILLLVAYYFTRIAYKKILNEITSKTIRYMTLYPVIAFLLLIKNYTIPFEQLKSFYPTWDMLFFIAFVILGYVLVFAGISSASEVIRLQYNLEKLEWESNTDSLTGLYNRRYIMERLENELTSYKRNKKQFSIIIADIDFFKKINDTFGHDCGDHVLKTVSKCLQDSVRKQDFVARWGGEEFMLLLPETDIEGARILVERIREITEQQVTEYNKAHVSITMTFGVTVNEDCEIIEDTIKKADNALYVGKLQGRNCVILREHMDSNTPRSSNEQS